MKCLVLIIAILLTVNLSNETLSPQFEKSAKKEKKNKIETKVRKMNKYVF